MRALRSSILGATCALLAACTLQTGTGPASGAGPLAADTGRVAVEGGTLYYDVRGSGPALVLLHAGGVDLTMWDPQVGPLARSFRLVRYDARGHGRSTAPGGPYSTTQDLRLLLDHLGIERASLVGISMGAGVALDFAANHPQRVTKLALVSTSGPPPGVPMPPGAAPPLTHEAGRARLRALTMPRILIVGEGDSPDHLAVAERVEAEVPQVRVVRVAGGPHFVNKDASEAFNRVLLGFLRER
ncbi:MAG TPA: alpha/beta fold hydrolase [Longimicrobium sp.]|jgi:pimeloyl-ACP methyl ester carboxylesterase